MSAELAVVSLIVGGLWLVAAAVVIISGGRQATQRHLAERAVLLADRERIRKNWGR